ncbi:MAG TPA: arylsulfotransferase family protein [Thermoanaerobaculia bacterium]|nr:arylsulfotransferase family protein [Thermoanaerobaculia bacterium]
MTRRDPKAMPVPTLRRPRLRSEGSGLSLLAAAILWAVPLLLFFGRFRTGAGTRPKTPGETAASREAARANEAAALSNLPYILQARDPRADRKGVVVDEKGRVSPGLNFLLPWSIERPGRAYLLDEDGRIVWRWSLESSLAGRKPRQWVGHFELLPDGSVVAVIHDDSIVELDRDSRIRWRTAIRAHHDVWRDPSGDLYALARRAELVPEIHPSRPIESDSIVVLSAEGKVKREISIIGLLRRSGYGYLLPRLQDAGVPRSGPAIDVFHTNHVETFDGRLAKRSPLFAKGNLLISIRNRNAIAIVDPRVEKIVWLWGPGNLAYQHDPRLLPNGHILVFDNGVERSQVVEIDPLTMRVAWRYAPGSEFFSRVVGAVQRLPNGNTLMTDSVKGRAAEVTPGGEIVWEYLNPEFSGKGLRNGILRMTRFPRDTLTFLPK